MGSYPEIREKLWAHRVEMEEAAMKTNAEVIEKYERMSDWLAGLYVNTLNLIQYMHDKYYYEAGRCACAGLPCGRF